MSETKKITAKQLDSLVKNQRELNDILVNIGILESQKHSLLHTLVEVNKNGEELKSVLQTQYGSVNINLQDGSYTVVNSDVAESEKVKIV